ncbi:hypothetical protein V2J94_12350 [Streptomyces sp. DSM 41524]|uniref:Uncharacterized protein n=1 Tax=Streptomyces asiaticus subsp. ignotus TaxID=3098222 RepID=A0ABU7PU85_9ACTN|nr:hypothetical protein [Streptomyces sp. DSM 41524]
MVFSAALTLRETADQPGAGRYFDAKILDVGYADRQYAPLMDMEIA